ncbi:MAG: helix-turn-helix domain-containing protein [Clostridia bacterium]|nr:helix-turn-helix domain-containing protein [Clostridia bacterium]
MQLELGQKIRELRHRDGRTQETLADALGVTSQAISRWEANGGYPDMEMIPAIANYFGVTIDELFGYENDRERKVDEIIGKVDAFSIKSRGDGEWIEECLAILREGLAVFPGNEKLLITLADTLSEAGWRRHREWLYYDEEGFIRHDYDRHKTNEFWNESIKICENLISSASDNMIAARAIHILVLLYRNVGENEKARAFATKLPELVNCRELLLAAASDGKEEAKYIGDFLLKSARLFAQQIVYGLIANARNFDGDFPIKKIKGAIDIFHLLCDDGNFGNYNGLLIDLYLYLSRLQWERGYRDEAFESLYKALEHAKAIDSFEDGKEYSFTAPLVSRVTFVKNSTCPRGMTAKELPSDWPTWCIPDYGEVEKEIKADPRWAEWVKKTQE